MTLGINLLLALLWTSIIGPFTPLNFIAGFIVGFVILRLVAGRDEQPRYVRQVRAVAALAVFTVVELVKANLRVALHTVSRLESLNPAVLSVPLEPDASDAEVTLLAMLVTLTPGTLTLDVLGDNDEMLIHFIHVDDVDEAIRDVKDGFERRILEVTR